MKKGWQNISFGELGRVFNGNSISEAEKKAHFEGVEDGVPYIGTKDVSFEHEVAYESGVKIPDDKRDGFKLAPANTVLVCAEGGSAGRKIAHTDREIYFGNKLFAVCPSPPISSRLIFYYCLSGDFTKQFKGSMAGLIGGVSINKFKELSVPVPPLAEQQRIVGLLDEAFEGLATAKANTEKNLQNARALFESHLQSVFTQRGPGWVEKRFDEVCAITSTLVDPRKKEFLDLTHVGAGNIESKTGVFVDLKTAREEGLISGKFLFDDSMVLYSKIRPYLMKVARPDFEGLCSADMYPLSPIQNVITRDYLFHLLLSKHFTDYAIQGSARAGMPKVNRDHVFEFRVFLPDVKKQKQLAANLDDLHEETQRLARLYEQKHAALEALKKSLLHQAFTGAL